MDRIIKKIVTSLSVIFLILLLALVSFSSGGITGAIVADAEVGSGLASSFDQAEQVSVIVVLKDDSTKAGTEEQQREAIKEKQEEVLADLRQEQGKDIFGLPQEKEFELEYQYENVNALAGKVTEEGLAKLRNDPNVDAIVVNKERQLFLSGSVPIINADDVWNMVVNNYNITGEGETVCVIDTGVDYNHSGFGGSGFGNKIIAGYDFYNNDSDPIDDQGHGTHVAGIVASADSVYKGVAPGTKIAAVKVCSSSGSCPDADVLAGIDWCMANKDTYNISILSISLGGGQYTSYCDGETDFAPYAAALNEAVAKNISIVAATGNSGAGNVAGPACIQNATRVTATTKSDTLPSYASRHAFFSDIIAAPGSAITSLKKGGETVTMSGTSMATPHVSGAIALMRQYWKQAYGREPTPEELKQKMIATGMAVYDAATGKNYSRLDIMAALQPVLHYDVIPQAAAIGNNTEFNISISSDVDLTQAWLQWTYPNGSIENLSLVSQTPTTFSLHLAGLSKGTHSYTINAMDAGGMKKTISAQYFTIDNIAPLVSLQKPSAYTNLSSGLFTFTALAQDEHSSLSTVLFNLSTSNSSSVSSSTFSAVGNNNSWTAEINLSGLAEGLYMAFAYANDSLGNENKSETVPFIVDRTAPTVTLLNSSFNTTETIPAVMFQVTDLLSAVADCTLQVDENLSSNTSAFLAMTNNSLAVNTTLSLGSHSVQVQCADASGNKGMSETITVTITAAPLPSTKNFVVELKTPQVNVVYNNETVWFTVSINSSENISMVKFNITNALESKSFSALQDTTSASDWKAQVNMTALAEGNHTVTVLAKNVLGQDNNSVSILFSIDRTGPALLAVTAADIDASSAQITWTTDELANAKVSYGTSPSLGTDKSVSANTLSHEITLSSLSAATTYHYTVTSCDTLANCKLSEVKSFTTTAVPAPGSDSASSGSSGSSGSGSGSSGDSSAASSEASEALGETEPSEEPTAEVPPKETLEAPATENSKKTEETNSQAQNTALAAASSQNGSSFGNLLTGFVSAAVFGDLSSKEYLLVALTALTVVLTIAFIVIRRREHRF